MESQPIENQSSKDASDADNIAKEPIGPTNEDEQPHNVNPEKSTVRMNYPPRRLTAPDASRKRKEVEPFHPSTLPKPLAPTTSVTRRTVSWTNSVITSPRGADQQQPLSSNRLLAGYMAHEFLTKGTLFGQIFDPSRAEAMPVSSAESKWSKQGREAEPKPQSYADVANLLKSDGVHIPGVVNPTQLARWIQM